MSESWGETLRTLWRWRRTRLPHALFVPAAAVVVLASAVGQDPAWPEVLGRLVAAWAAMALLRLWDDLEDREVDRRAHADRVRLDAAGRIGWLIAAGLSVVAVERATERIPQHATIELDGDRGRVRILG